MSIEVVQRNAFTGMAAAVEAAWRRHAERLDGAFLAVFNHHSGKAAGQDQAPRAAEPRRPAESEAMREARLDARERRVRAEMRKRNEFIPRDDSSTARVNAKANPFVPKDLEIDGRNNPFLP